MVYAKAPFGGPQQVLEYLGRCPHRLAISNQRLVKLENGQVSLQWKDYRDQTNKVMTVAAEEFIRLLLQHSLPTGLQRIRYYGFHNGLVLHGVSYRDTRSTVGTLPGSSSRNWGSMRASCQRTPKNRCGPVARPVDPTRPSV